MSAPLPPGRSPWTFELVDLPPLGSGLLVRIHHCIADGRALVGLLGQLADGGVVSDLPPPPRRTAPRRSLARRVCGPLVDLVRLFRRARDPANLLRRALSGRKSVAWSEAIPLDALKAIASAHEDHLADVLLAAVAGALNRYARDQGKEPRSIHALLPVAGAPDPSGGDLGNHYASVFVSVPAGVDDRRIRLEAIEGSMAIVRSSGQSRIATALMNLAGSLAPGLERWALRWGARRASLVVSSLAGPTKPLRVAGQPLGAVVIWAPAPASIGLSLTLFGYAGAIRLGVLADRAVIERPEQLVAAFQAEVDELRGQALR